MKVILAYLPKDSKTFFHYELVLDHRDGIKFSISKLTGKEYPYYLNVQMLVQKENMRIETYSFQKLISEEKAISYLKSNTIQIFLKTNINEVDCIPGADFGVESIFDVRADPEHLFLY